MPRGTPDWEVLDTERLLLRVTDLSEAAARLGAISTFHRGGNLLWMDDFESGLDARWAVQAVGTGAAVELSMERARSGMYSCKLTGGSDSIREARIASVAPLPSLSIFGFEASFDLDTNLERIDMDFELYTGIQALVGGLRYDQAAQTMAVEVQAGLFTTVATGVLLAVPARQFHTVKFTIDADKGNYGTLIFGPSRIDLSALSPHTVVSATTRQAIFRFDTTSDSGQNSVVYVDDIIITDSEPV